MSNKKRRIMEYFDSYADSYPRRGKERFRDLPDFLSENIKRGAKILDIGCGKGGFIDYIKNFGYQTFGIDFSREMLSLSPSNLNLIQGNADYLPFKSNTFEVAYMDTILHHMIGDSYAHTRELQKFAIKEVIRVMRPQGIIILRELYFDLPSSLISKIAFYYLLFCSKISVKPFPGELPVCIDIKSKKRWSDLFSNFKEIEIIKKDIFTSKRFRFKFIRSGNIRYFFRKVG